MSVFLFSLPIFAEGVSYLEKFYFGGLYIGSMDRNFYQFQNDILPLAAVKTIFPVASGYLRSRVFYDFKTPRAHLWWMKRISFFEFDFGYFSRPIAIINRPDPVSSDFNFEPPSRAVIPGPAFGALGRVKSQQFGSDLMLGLYKTRKESIEFNFGFQQNINWAIFHKFGVTGYSDGKFRGVALNGELEKVSLMFFSGRDRSSVKTQSGLLNLNLTENASLWAFFINRDAKWQQVQIGVCKLFSEKVSAVPINYLLGIAYNYSEIKPNSIDIYLQVWLDKK
ncbi:MAG: hypothetical protein ACOZAL_02190 [Patescibacteria group bacterium]